jgi:hypothetical protein
MRRTHVANFPSKRRPSRDQIAQRSGLTARALGSAAREDFDELKEEEHTTTPTPPHKHPSPLRAGATRKLSESTKRIHRCRANNCWRHPKVPRREHDVRGMRQIVAGERLPAMRPAPGAGLARRRGDTLTRPQPAVVTDSEGTPLDDHPALYSRRLTFENETFIPYTASSRKTPKTPPDSVGPQRNRARSGYDNGQALRLNS